MRCWAESFEPRPRWILATKAFISIVVALQLAHPVVSTTLREITRPGDAESQATRESSESSSGWVKLQSATSLESVSGSWTMSDEGATRGADGSRIRPVVFFSRSEEGWWITVLTALVLVIAFIEYEWIVRPQLSHREDRALDPGERPSWGDHVQSGGSEESPGSSAGARHAALRRRLYRSWAALTFPWVVYRAWLPILVVGVNLGFETLDHRRVVQAMLVGLREHYHRTFLAWNSAVANLGRFVGLAVLTSLVTLVGQACFVPSEPLAKTFDRGGSPDITTFCKEVEHSRDRRSTEMIDVLCDWGGYRLVRLTYFDLIQFETGESALLKRIRQAGRREPLVFQVLPESDPVARDGAEPSSVRRQSESSQDAMLGGLVPTGLNLCLYHILLFLLFFLTGRWVLHRFPVLPYHRGLRRIDDLLDSLSSRRRVTSRRQLWKPAEWARGLLPGEQVQETETEPVDPRTVEIAFLGILEEMQRGGIRLPGAARDTLSLPSPEITFVFDELDKLGTRADPKGPSLPSTAEEERILNAERKRSMALLALLSDLKNLLSSAPARFVFVGGRNLHDEWLADQTARQPLLTNIFNAEVYLPSLLTDHEGREPRAFHDRIRQYLFNEYAQARELYRRATLKRWRPSGAQSPRVLAAESFAQELEAGRSDSATHRSQTAQQPEDPPRSSGDKDAGDETEESLARRPELEIRRCDSGRRICESESRGSEERGRNAERAFIRDFCYFLAYRSMGNPKRLRELLSRFVRPVGRMVRDTTVRWRDFPCRHVLWLPDTEIFRIQLIVDIYLQVQERFEERLVQRDDKLAISAFFLTDFLFKFHRRAFSWGNLERVDELVHIHRAPDLRELLEEIVDQYSERYLHRVLNGMYAFRFRSDVAREVEYLSRQSPEEMAAFNFTLDESQSLKALYAANLERMDRARPEVVAGLGELFEFDQEFDTARQHYRQAIELLDDELERAVWGSRRVERVGTAESSMVEILASLPRGLRNARLFVTWGHSRIRLMLQIGMSYEHARKLERAEAEYRNCRTLARALLRAFLDAEGRQQDPYADPMRADLAQPNSRLDILKHLNILFQPMFAEAWVMEKLVGGVDTSISLAEKGLWELRMMLPFVRDPRLILSDDPAAVRGSNFGLIMSQLHKKAGDLYFLKGRQAVPAGRLGEIVSLFLDQEREELESGAQQNGGDENEDHHPSYPDGYLQRAHYHYAVALHELRRFIHHRRVSSKFKLCIARHQAPIFLEGGHEGLWPDFLYRGLASTVSSMAEATLARVSLFGLRRRLRGEGEASIFRNRDLNQGAANGKRVEDLVDVCFEWFELDDASASEQSSLDFQLDDGCFMELPGLHSRFGSWTSAQSFLDSKQPLVTFEEPHTPEQRLFAAVHLAKVGAKAFEVGGYPEEAAREYLQICETVACHLWWQRIVAAIVRWRQSEAPEPDRDIEVGSVARTVWRRARTVLDECEGRTSGSRGEGGATSAAPPLFDRGPYDSVHNDEQIFFRALIQLALESLEYHRYPMKNRLVALKILVDDRLLGRLPQPPAEADDHRRVVEQAEELLKLTNHYGSPWHFTPFQSGVTCALLWMRLLEESLRADGATTERDRRDLEDRRRKMAGSRPARPGKEPGDVHHAPRVLRGHLRPLLLVRRLQRSADPLEPRGPDGRRGADFVPQGTCRCRGIPSPGHLFKSGVKQARVSGQRGGMGEASSCDRAETGLRAQWKQRVDSGTQKKSSTQPLWQSWSQQLAQRSPSLQLPGSPMGPCHSSRQQPTLFGGQLIPPPGPVSVMGRISWVPRIRSVPRGADVAEASWVAGVGAPGAAATTAASSRMAVERRVARRRI